MLRTYVIGVLAFGAMTTALFIAGFTTEVYILSYLAILPLFVFIYLFIEIVRLGLWKLYHYHKSDDTYDGTEPPENLIKKLPRHF